MSDVAHALCTSQERVDLFEGLVRFRKDLVAAGLDDGVQWLDGSFCENVEALRGRSPGDIDLVTLFRRPPTFSTSADWAAFVTSNAALFDRGQVRANYRCDAFFLDAGISAHMVLPQITYWFGLFTHQRDTLTWKGMVVVPLQSDDIAALAYAHALSFYP
jgi:hypothetical protein